MASDFVPRTVAEIRKAAREQARLRREAMLRVPPPYKGPIADPEEARMRFQELCQGTPNWEAVDPTA